MQQSHKFASLTYQHTSQGLQKSMPFKTHLQKDNAAKISTQGSGKQ